jgi:hypothetical protein
VAISDRLTRHFTAVWKEGERHREIHGDEETDTYMHRIRGERRWERVGENEETEWNTERLLGRE